MDDYWGKGYSWKGDYFKGKYGKGDYYWYSDYWKGDIGKGDSWKGDWWKGASRLLCRLGFCTFAFGKDSSLQIDVFSMQQRVVAFVLTNRTRRIYADFKISITELDASSDSVEQLK